MRTVSLAEFSLAEFPAGHRERLLLAALPGLIGSVSLPALVAREAVRDALAAGQPSVHINAESGGLIISTHCLRPGDERIIVERLRLALDGDPGKQGEDGHLSGAGSDGDRLRGVPRRR